VQHFTQAEVGLLDFGLWVVVSTDINVKKTVVL